GADRRRACVASMREKTTMAEPRLDVAHLGHLELYSDRFEESVDFFTRVYVLPARHVEDGVAWLRASDDHEFPTVKLPRHHTTGIGHVGYRTASPEALERRVAVIEKMGCAIGWVDGDHGHGRAFRFTDPDGHIFELYYDTRIYEARPEER